MKKIKEIYNNHREIIVYLIVGVLTTVVSFVSYYLCTKTFLNPKDGLQLQIANIISWVCAVTFAYFTNRIFVFRSKNKNKINEAFLFYSSRIITLIMDMCIMWFMVTLLGCNDLIAKIVVQVVVTIGNYIISKFFVFNKKEK